MARRRSPAADPVPDPAAELSWPTVPSVETPVPQEERRDWRNLSHEQRFQIQHESLLRVTRKLADERGYAGTQISSVVALAGVSRRTFYEHFATKEACFAELLLRAGVRSVPVLIVAAEGALADGPYPTIRALIDAWSGIITEGPTSPLSPTLAATLWQEASRPESPLAGTLGTIIDLITDVMAVAAQRLGSPLDNDLLQLAARQQVKGLVGVVRPLHGPLDEHQHAQIARMVCVSLGFLEAAQAAAVHVKQDVPATSVPAARARRPRASRSAS